MISRYQLIPIVCVLASWVFSVQMSGVFGGELDLTDAQNVKLSKQKAKARVEKNRGQESYFELDENDKRDAENLDCGSVDIGNVNANHTFVIPRTINLIITGDVINAHNDC